VLLTPPDARGHRAPWAFALPETPDALRAMGRSYAATIFLTAGNMTHTPGYGHLIALGIHDVVRQRKVSPQQTTSAAPIATCIAHTGRFLTFSAGAATIGYRLREDPNERAAPRVVRETGAGLVLRGKVGMHTSPAYAEDVYIGAHSGVDRDGHRATFIVPVNAPGVTVLCRKISARHANPFLAPLSSRFDELDGQMWLEDVLVPWERVFLTEPSPDPIAAWCFWHQLYAWLAKAEFTLGLALACAHAMGLKEHEPTIEYLMDLVIDVQTVRSCQTAAELDPGRLGGGLLHSRARPRGRGQHRHAEGAAAHGGDPENRSRVIARGGAVGQGPDVSGGGRGTRGVVRRGRVHGAPARGFAPACRRPRRLGPGRPRVLV
jgi:Aromatic ring hydroxylase